MLILTGRGSKNKQIWSKKSVSKKDSAAKSHRSDETKRSSKKSVEEIRKKPSKSDEHRIQNAKLRTVSEGDVNRKGIKHSASNENVPLSVKSSRQSGRKSDAMLKRYGSLDALTDDAVAADPLSPKTSKPFVSEPRLSVVQRLRHWSKTSLGLSSVPTEEQCKQNAASGMRIDQDELLPADSYVSWRVECPVRLQMAAEGPLSQKPITIMTLIKEVSEKYTLKPALAFRGSDNHVEMSYESLLDNIYHAALSFIKLGLKSYYGVGILADNSIEYVVAFFGVIFAGGICCPLYTCNSPEFSFKMLKDARCQILVVDSMDERKQVTFWKRRLPDLLSIIQIDFEGFKKTEGVYLWTEFLELGSEVSFEKIQNRIMQQAPNACCCIMQTAGTTGTPKNAMISHDNLVWSSYNRCKATTLAKPNSVFCVLHPFGSLVSLNVLVAGLRNGATVYMTSLRTGNDSIIKSLKEVKPTILVGHVLLWEEVQEKLEEDIEQNPIKRFLVRWATDIGRRRIRNNKLQSSRFGCWPLAHHLLLRRIRSAAGLGRCLEFYTEGSPMLENSERFFLSLNIPVNGVYSSVETTGLCTLPKVDGYKLGSVGFPIGGCTLTIKDPDPKGVGTFLFSGRNVAMGYLLSEKTTKASFDETDGTFKSDDLGSVDEEGFVFILGKKSETLLLSTGHAVMTMPLKVTIKNRLPFVNCAFIVGEGYPYLAILLTLKLEIDTATNRRTNRLTAQATRWFRQNGFDMEYINDIASKGGLRFMHKIQNFFDELNAEAAHESQRIIRWIILPEDFKTADDDLGPTLKPKRWYLTQKYAATIDALYPGKRKLSKSITFRL